MSRYKEQLKELARQDREAEKLTPPDKNRHYSQTPHHAKRSIANDRRKKSKRRGNYG